LPRQKGKMNLKKGPSRSSPVLIYLLDDAADPNTRNLQKVSDSIHFAQQEEHLDLIDTWNQIDRAKKGFSCFM